MIYWVSADIFQRGEVPEDFWALAGRANKEIERRGIMSDRSAVNELWAEISGGCFPEVPEKRFRAVFTPGDGAGFPGIFGADNMSCEIEDHEGNRHRLFAEESIPDEYPGEDEFSARTHARLKAEIIRQAAECGVGPEYLVFDPLPAGLESGQ